MKVCVDAFERSNCLDWRTFDKPKDEIEDFIENGWTDDLTWHLKRAAPTVTRKAAPTVTRDEDDDGKRNGHSSFKKLLYSVYFCLKKK